MDWRRWAASVAEPDTQVDTEVEPGREDWGTFYPKDIVQRGYILWRASGYAVIPDPEKIATYDERWLTDLNLVARLVRFQEDKDALPGMGGL